MRNSKRKSLTHQNLCLERRSEKSWISVTTLLQANLRYLEAVFDVVARLADAHRLQHAGVAQLPQHQVVAKPQGQLGDAEGKKIRKDAVRDGWTTLGPKKTPKNFQGDPASN